MTCNIRVADLAPGQVALLENVRFYPEEEKNDPEFAQKLAKLADVYVNDAFGTAHRAHASTEGGWGMPESQGAGFPHTRMDGSTHEEHDHTHPHAHKHTFTSTHTCRLANIPKTTTPRAGMAKYVKHTSCGFLMQKELDHLALDACERPLAAVVGGAKVSTKLPVIQSLMAKW